MTDITLSKILKNINLKYCKLIDETPNINIYTTQINASIIGETKDKYTMYDFAIITDKLNIPVGIIFKMDNIDIHAYIPKRYRKHGYMREALSNRVLYDLWDDVKCISIKSPDEDDPCLINRYYSILLSLWGEKITHYDSTVIGETTGPNQAIIDYLTCIDRKKNDNHKTLFKMIDNTWDYSAWFVDEEDIREYFYLLFDLSFV